MASPDLLAGGAGDLISATFTALGAANAVSGSRKEKREARRQAAQVQRDALRQQDTSQKAAERVLGSQQAGYGAAGVQQESGSSQEVFNETLFNALLANQEILTGAKRVEDTILYRAAAQDRAIKRAAELQYAQTSIQGGIGIAKLVGGLV